MAIGTVAVVAALVVSLAVPTFSLALFNGDGSGGGGDNEVQITNPMADLHRDLQRGEDIPLMQVTAVGIRPTYLRITALTQYSGGTWRPGDRDLPAANAATGPVPAPVGLESRVPRENRDMTVQINDSFSSLWLPTPLVVSQARAGTDWRYDRSVMDFHSAEDDITTAGLSYELVESRPEIDQEALAGARPPTSSMVRDYTSLPDDLPEIVHRLAEEVTDGRESSYDKAVALQNWFRSPENFTYSLETDEGAVVGNGNAALQRFLSEDGRVGYCEQFAASMALMARSLGIPARVSVGLLRPDRIATDTYEFSSHDMHAWPELWFDGYGWVMFEPTPQDRATVVPEYTVGSGEDGPRPNEPTEAPTTSAPSQDPTQEPTQEPTAPEDAAPARKGSEKDGFNLAWLGLIPVALLLLLLPVAPGWVRRRRTHRRLATGDVEQAWLEVHDVASDLGRAWPEHRSPRDTGRAVMDWLGAVPPPAREQRPATGPLANPTAAQAVERLVALLERERYAPASAPPDRTELAELVRTSTAALHAGATLGPGGAPPGSPAPSSASSRERPDRGRGRADLAGTRRRSPTRDHSRRCEPAVRNPGRAGVASALPCAP
ncbi:transglutaminase family protein [Nocardioides alcanivorans]|uniref:transglutaminase family protein n=1 Tax=Nocardioides alcanivorans TaxID=2897352 RepID=UPI0035DE900E